jgi:hypothetical protein
LSGLGAVCPAHCSCVAVFHALTDVARICRPGGGFSRAPLVRGREGCADAVGVGLRVGCARSDGPVGPLSASGRVGCRLRRERRSAGFGRGLPGAFACVRPVSTGFARGSNKPPLSGAFKVRRQRGVRLKNGDGWGRHRLRLRPSTGLRACAGGGGLSALNAVCPALRLAQDRRVCLCATGFHGLSPVAQIHRPFPASARGYPPLRKAAADRRRAGRGIGRGAASRLRRGFGAQAPASGLKDGDGSDRHVVGVAPVPRFAVMGAGRPAHLLLAAAFPTLTGGAKNMPPASRRLDGETATAGGPGVGSALGQAGP